MTKRGKPKYQPTQAQRDNVRVMAACGMPQDLICRQLPNPHSGEPIDKKTLRLAFRDELDNGMETANAMVTRSLYMKAVGDGKNSVTAAIFWLKCRAGWKDPQAHEHSGPDGKPIAVVNANMQTTLPVDPNDAVQAYMQLINGK